MNTHKILLKESMSDKRINFYNVHENREKEILEYYKTLPDIKKKMKKLEQQYVKKNSLSLKVNNNSNQANLGSCSVTYYC